MAIQSLQLVTRTGKTFSVSGNPACTYTMYVCDKKMQTHQKGPGVEVVASRWYKHVSRDGSVDVVGGDAFSATHHVNKREEQLSKQANQ